MTQTFLYIHKELITRTIKDGEMFVNVDFIGEGKTWASAILDSLWAV